MKLELAGCSSTTNAASSAISAPGVLLCPVAPPELHRVMALADCELRRLLIVPSLNASTGVQVDIAFRLLWVAFFDSREPTDTMFLTLLCLDCCALLPTLNSIIANICWTARFCKNYDIEHVTSSPNYPQSNGKVENAVKTTMKRPQAHGLNTLWLVRLWQVINISSQPSQESVTYNIIASHTLLGAMQHLAHALGAMSAETCAWPLLSNDHRTTGYSNPRTIQSPHWGQLVHITIIILALIIFTGVGGWVGRSGHTDGNKKNCKPSTSCPWPPRTLAPRLPAPVRNRFSAYFVPQPAENNTSFWVSFHYSEGLITSQASLLFCTVLPE